MRNHEKQGSSGSSSSRRTPIILFLLALGAALVWFLRRRHIDGIAEADAWREHLPEWAGPIGTSAEAAARSAEAPAAATSGDVAAASRAKPAPVPTSAPAATPAAEAPPAAPAAATDDLRRVEGIGPKIAAALTAAGLGTYAAVADASDGDLRAALKDAGLRFAPSLSTWARQARLLADGDEAGFVALTDRLVAGREES